MKPVRKGITPVGSHSSLLIISHIRDDFLHACLEPRIALRTGVIMWRHLVSGSTMVVAVCYALPYRLCSCVYR